MNEWYGKLNPIVLYVSVVLVLLSGPPVHCKRKAMTLELCPTSREVLNSNFERNTE